MPQSPSRRWRTRKTRRWPPRSYSAAAPTPARSAPESIGSYARGCVAGATAIPTDGETWQVMRLSRNRNWGHPDLIQLLQKLSARLPQINGWPGLLVGDISQPRGGPMITGHASHQIGLDADVWLTPMPQRRLSRLEREELSATDMVRPDLLDVDPAEWTPEHTALIKARGAGARGRAHLRQSGHQESSVPRGRFRPQLAVEGADRCSATIIISTSA